MTEPIRVLHVFGRLDTGGAETMIMNVYRNIDRSKVQFDFIVHTKEKCDFDGEVKHLGGKIHRIQQYIGRNHFQYKKAWHNFFRQHPEYNIIHGHMRSTAAIYLKIAKQYGLTTIAHSHSTSSGSGFSAIAKNILQYPIRYISDYFFACSENAGKWLFGKQILRSNKFFIVKNTIDSKSFVFNKLVRLKKRKEFNIEDKFVIGHIGRFSYPKNHMFLLDIFKEIHKENENAILMLVGDGELRQQIERKIIDLNLLDNVIFTGVRSDVPELLQAMDVFVFPSLYEGLGIVTIEAQAAGVPCIVADTIPKEAYVTDLIKPICLKESAIIWAENILKYTNKFKRRNTYEEIKNSGYDILETTKWLQDFYMGSETNYD
ncbi:glycosyltransferase family 1 protein [Garciella nitratireducens]|uniref:Glycosyltransferase involved in cell wall bisynthesis n=1 Tax=Garciella nitratireducens DSM 15102 TaxID=1121911 RepID=A0A1T4P908_9FIRM|nr:glycosyltransferase family 1 protein [Garciella nitratireducens]SJZ87871.1 Glycosyltransferase involved in cell wall bisynthesis [Garciella nitratireducens DSM 15102]